VLRDFFDEVVVRLLLVAIHSSRIIMSFVNMRITVRDETWKAIVNYFVHKFSCSYSYQSRIKR